MKKLKDKVAVITGGSNGIGLATAQKFVQEGADVFITGRSQAKLDKAKAEIGSHVTTVQGDVSNLDDLEKLYKTIKEEKGSIDIVVANAGFVAMIDTANVSSEHFNKTFNVNARGTFFTVQKAFPLLNDHGAIVVISSVVSAKGFPNNVTYGASKATVKSYVKSWAADLKERNIRANSVSPGIIDTTMLDGQFPTKEEADELKSYFANITPLGRLGKPEEVANAILFLSSSDSSFITGTDIPVDGGYVEL